MNFIQNAQNGSNPAGSATNLLSDLMGAAGSTRDAGGRSGGGAQTQNKPVDLLAEFKGGREQNAAKTGGAGGAQTQDPKATPAGGFLSDNTSGQNTVGGVLKPHC
ncbi:hypothetical protein U8607_17550 [Methylobacterium durans]|uniref:hypothetical protein n=1 Tax=Methylobacterium durans TaxID=2202825 RepID=UPI002AFFBFC2|nr:hypothetical protein [Methylobacterium durans]MEA1833895.1 hypothetical protein [Methylobacterium durans]